MSQRNIETTIDIAAPVGTVWRALADFPSYSQWSRFILSIEGEARPGARLSVQIDDGGGVMRMRPLIVTFDENVQLCWLGFVGASFLFSGEHAFRLEPLSPNVTRFTQSETFNGVLVPLFWKRLDNHTRRAFHSFDDALRERAEALVVAR
jgi:hypothetical protein